MKRALICVVIILGFLLQSRSIQFAQSGGAPGTSPAARAASNPKLVVLIIVDQMRGDYIDHFSGQWSHGLARLVRGGAWFRRAAFPYANTVTCVGHAAVSTGTLPATNGIVGNSWLDRAAWKSVACADNPGASTISYGLPVTASHGPDRLLVPALPDEMRAQLPGPVRVVTMSMKPRTAIMFAGRRADSATWFNPAAHAMVTSSAYASAPVPFVSAFTAANPIEAEFTTPWDRALPADRYLFTDDGVGEKPPSYWTKTFPHPMSGLTNETDAWSAWEGSPKSDAYLGRLAVAAVDALKLGQGRGTDYLGISFSALDHVGHDYGPRSHEAQDVLVRLDRTLGALLDHLDRRVGAGRYVVALTADHGAALIPEQAAVTGADAGRLATVKVTKAAQEALQRAIGAGEYKLRLSGSDLYLEPSVLERVRATPQAAETIVRALRAAPGVGAAFDTATLGASAAAGDRQARAALASYRPERSGDFIVYPRAGWFFVSDDGSAQPGDGTSHGLPYTYDQRVPVVLYGAGVKPGEYLRAVTPLDIAPTLGFLVNVTLPRPDGEVLVEALVPRAR